MKNQTGGDLKGVISKGVDIYKKVKHGVQKINNGINNLKEKKIISTGLSKIRSLHDNNFLRDTHNYALEHGFKMKKKKINKM